MSCVLVMHRRSFVKASCEVNWGQALYTLKAKTPSLNKRIDLTGMRNAHVSRMNELKETFPSM